MTHFSPLFSGERKERARIEREERKKQECWVQADTEGNERETEGVYKAESTESIQREEGMDAEQNQEQKVSEGEPKV